MTTHYRMPRGCGHGHVFPLPAGAKVRCGGRALCQECARDAAKLAALPLRERAHIERVRAVAARKLLGGGFSAAVVTG